jgi:transcriptional regulator with XRE-family HTH domain
MTTTDMPKKVHEGQNIKRFREMLGIKQDALAQELGNDWTQSKISHLEAKDTIDPAILDEVAKVLKIPVEAIKNFDEEAAIVNIQTNYQGANAGSGTIGNNLNYHNCTFNPIDKWLDALEENKKLYAALLKEKDEKIALLEKLAGEKKK